MFGFVPGHKNCNFSGFGAMMSSFFWVALKLILG